MERFGLTLKNLKSSLLVSILFVILAMVFDRLYRLTFPKMLKKSYIKKLQEATATINSKNSLKIIILLTLSHYIAIFVVPLIFKTIGVM